MEFGRTRPPVDLSVFQRLRRVDRADGLAGSKPPSDLLIERDRLSFGLQNKVGQIGESKT